MKNDDQWGSGEMSQRGAAFKKIPIADVLAGDRALLSSAEVIRVRDEKTGNWVFVFGRTTWRKHVEAQRKRRPYRIPRQLTVLCDETTDDLTKLLAILVELRGSHDFHDDDWGSREPRRGR